MRPIVKVIASALALLGCGSEHAGADGGTAGVREPVSPGLLNGGFREVVSLNQAGWRFLREDFAGEEPADPEFDAASWLRITLPHDFNGGSDGVHADVFEGPRMYLGAGWYRATVPVKASSRGKRLFILFEAVSSKADVWFNGAYLGQHRGGYTAFEFEVTELARWGEDNLLVVRASNDNDPEIAPWMAVPFGSFPQSSDYAVYGGIYRDVWLVERESVSIRAHFHDTPEVSAARGTLAFSTSVENASSEALEVSLVTEILDGDGALVQSAERAASIEAGWAEEITGELELDRPELWSPEHPYLYTLRSRVRVDQEILDELESPLGFRWYTLKNGAGFVLNGQDSFLKGVNRHQDREGLGYALPNEQHQRDVELIKGMGFNFVRHAHYPADEAFLRACDRVGLLVWLEIPVSTAVSPEPGFLENAKSQLTEMIVQAYNHPSVIVWGIGNESDRIGARNEEASAAYTTEFLSELNDTAKRLDPTRPTTGCNFENPENHAIVDVYSPQDWSGWYGGSYTDYAPSALIGEYGADVHLSHHDESFRSSALEQPWTQEYGAEVHEYKASLGRSLENEFPGQLVWVAFDFASPRVDRETNPIPFMNQKGLYLHDHETRKDAAYFYESFYTDGAENPMVYVVSETWLDRLESPGTVTLWAYSNAESVELFTGTEADPKAASLGTRLRDAGPRGDTRFQWDDANVTGPAITAEASIGGEVVATHSITFEGSW